LREELLPVETVLEDNEDAEPITEVAAGTASLEGAPSSDEGEYEINTSSYMEETLTLEGR
jgi:hypothetical protein